MRKQFPKATMGRIKHFKPREFDYPHLVDVDTLLQLEAMRTKEEGIIITINSDYRKDDKGMHGWGKALDMVIRNARDEEPLPVVEQFLIAVRYVGWTGIGIYLDWKVPGIHADTRPKTRFDRRAFWYRKDGIYRKINEIFEPLFD